MSIVKNAHYSLLQPRLYPNYYVRTEPKDEKLKNVWPEKSLLIIDLNSAN